MKSRNAAVLALVMAAMFLVCVGSSTSAAGLATSKSRKCPGAPVSPASRSSYEFATTEGGVEVTGLMVGKRIPFRAGDTVKIIVRASSSSGLRLSVHSSGGRLISPIWGPKRHIVAIGEELGVGVLFSSSGCWRLGFEVDGERLSVGLLIM